MLGLQINQAKSRSSYHPKPKIWKHYQTLRLWAIIIIFLMFTWWLGPQTCHRVVICHFSKLLKAKHFSLSSTIPDPKKNLTAAALVVEAQEFLLEFSKGESWSSFFGHDHIRCWLASGAVGHPSLQKKTEPSKNWYTTCLERLLFMSLVGVKLTKVYLQVRVGQLWKKPILTQLVCLWSS